ncbi:MAG: lysylphosphatidylglycerol synthase transmembrane domain-containing protein [Vallitaleaceae bacterium]|nr:lysylphosphatidylglycerol synthase transmembrane domain-containing protein [Vallitaleaceae bacterium]
MKKNKWYIILVVAIFIGTISYLIYSGEMVTVTEQLLNLNPYYFLLCVGAIIAYWMTEAKITNDMVRSTGNKQPYNKALEVTMIGQFFNGITPFSSGGQPAQLYFLTKQKLPIGKGSSVLMSKFIIYQAVLVVYSIVFLSIRAKQFETQVDHLFYIVLIGFIVNVFVIAMLLFFSFAKKSNLYILTKIIKLLHKVKIVKNPEERIQKYHNDLKDFHKHILLLKNNGKLFARIVLLSVIQLAFYFIIPFLIYRSFGLEGADLISMIAGTGFVLMVTSFIPIPGASGGAEGGFVLIFGLFFISHYIITAIVIWRLITYYLGILIGGIWMMFAKIRTE